MGRLDGKTAIITGGASGVGKEDAILFVREGASVVIADVNQADGEALAKELGAKAMFQKLDITNEAEWQAVIAATKAKFGGLDILVNNAGILKYADIENTSVDEYRTIMKVNAEGYFLGCKYGVLAMKDNTTDSSIINMASLASISGMPGFAAYSCSKGAVAALTRVVAVHCKNNGYKIRCNSIMPDGILTPMVTSLMPPPEAGQEVDPKAMARLTMPENVANVVLFLASPEANFVNGADVKVDNAYTITGTFQ